MSENLLSLGSTSGYDCVRIPEGLPDVIFPGQKSQFGNILACLRMQIVGTFYVRWEYFTFLWYIFLHFGTSYQEQSGNPGFR
jgi:hypothetical protein